MNQNERPVPIVPPVESPDQICPVCGSRLIQEKCKVVCRSHTCRYRVVMTCAEF